MAPEHHLEPLHSETVDVTRVGQALQELWKKADNSKDEEAAIVRACGLTVIGLAFSDAELMELSAEIGTATSVVPARTLLVQSGADIEGGLSAEVAAFCTLPGPDRKQVCHEQVLLRAARPRAEDLPALITPLTVPDLPAVLILGSHEAIHSRLVERLLPAIDVLITDTRGCKDVHGTFRKLLAIRDGRRVKIRDLAFERLATWRETIANAYDEVLTNRERLMAVEANCVGNDAEGSLLLGWIESRFPPGRRPFCQLDRTARRETGIVTGIRMTVAGAGAPRTIAFEQRGRHVLRLDEGDHTTTCELPRPTPDDRHLLTRILIDPQNDRIYDRTLRTVVERFATR